MGNLDMTAQVQIEFQNNWDTFIDPEDIPIHYPDRSFNSDNLTQYIALNFIPLQDDLIGVDGSTTGRIEYAGMIYVSCFNRGKMMCFKLADMVTEFLRGKELPLGVRILSEASPSTPIDLPNDFYEIIVSFPVRQC